MYEFDTDTHVSYYFKLEEDAIITKKAKVRWNLEFDIRNWGVKGIHIVVPDQIIVLVYDKWDEETDTYVEVEKRIELTNVEVDMYNDIDCSTLIVAPNELEILETGITLRF